MKNEIIQKIEQGSGSPRCLYVRGLYLIFLFFICTMPVSLLAQESDEMPSDRPIQNVFESVWLIESQSVSVPMKGTLEFDINHRFGFLSNGLEDFFGLYAPSNIRMGLSYAPIENLNVGIGFTKRKNLLDFSGKYAILKQTRSGSMPLSLTYFGNITMDPRGEDNRSEVYNESDRYTYFHQLIIGRKFADWLSLQVAPSLSHFNIIDDDMNNDHVSLHFGGQFAINESFAIITNVDQPISKHDTGNPNPNLSLGVQFTTSSHSFQIFLTNYNALNPQENHMFNMNDFTDSFEDNFLIGFNITRLWSL